MYSNNISIKKSTLFITLFLSLNLVISQSDSLTLKVNDNKKISLLYNLASFNIRGYQNYKTGIPLCEKLLEELKKENSINTVEYARALVLYTQGLGLKGEYNTAIEKGLRANKIFNENPSNFSRDHVANLIELSRIYYDIGNINKSLTFSLNAMRICEKSLNPDKEMYSSSINSVASLYDDIGQIKTALLYYKKAYEVANSGSSSILSKGVILNNLSFINRRLGYYNKATEYAKEALLFVENNQGKDHSHYGGALNNLAITYELSEEYDSAFIYYTKALENIEKSIGNNTFYYANILHNLARLNEKINDTETAFSQYSQAKEIVYNNFGTENILYKDIITSLSNYYNSIGNYKKALTHLKEKDNLTHNLIKNNFLYLTTKEKQDFIINTIGTEGLNHFANFNYLSGNKHKEAVPLALNNILTSKGLVLNATRDLLADLKSLNDIKLNKDIKRFTSQRQFITKQLQLPKTERTDTLIKVQDANNNLERSLVIAYSKHFNSEINYVKDYKDTNLNSKEIAIEFTHFELYNKKWTDSIIYAAYLYKKGWKSPKVINLFEEGELKDYFEKYSSRGAIAITKQKNDKVAISELLYELIWQPLEPFLKDVETIYYSPDGLLHKVPINALPTNEGRFLGEIYDLNRVSNTAYINTNKRLPDLNDSVLFGDIIYDYSKSNDTIRNDAANYEILNSKDLLKSKENKDRNTRSGSWDYLPGTKKEIEFIKTVLPESEILRQRKATETAYKELSGNSPSILHISTHGFFFPDLEKENRTKTAGYVLSEDPMLRSGLILANANYAWKNGSNPFEEDDGILTALDISNLDLRKTDIVILSACETGLGDIPSSEGVFGLQRAFKMAGVNTIIMTLWEVPDKETAEFMKMFYKKWKVCKNPKEAFKHAQNYMMKRYRYQPDKWAAFVLFE